MLHFLQHFCLPATLLLIHVADYFINARLYLHVSSKPYAQLIILIILNSQESQPTVLHLRYTNILAYTTEPCAKHVVTYVKEFVCPGERDSFEKHNTPMSVSSEGSATFETGISKYPPNASFAISYLSGSQGGLNKLYPSEFSDWT